MSEVEIINADVEVHTLPGGETIVVTTDKELTIIQTLEQGPPGVQGPIGPMGPQGADGSTGPLDGLLDVDTTGVATGSRLAFNGSVWVDEKPHSHLHAQNITSGTSLSISRTTDEVALIALTGTVTSFTVSGWPPPGTLGRLVLQITNTGAFDIAAWPTGTIWPGGVAPTVTAGIGKKDIIILMTFDGGPTIFGTVAGKDYV